MRNSTSKALDNWLASVNAKADGFTATEVADRLGCSRDHANVLIRRGIRDGKLKYAGRVERINVCGGKMMIPGYTMV